jgi:hypothetical protein
MTLSDHKGKQIIKEMLFQSVSCKIFEIFILIEYHYYHYSPSRCQAATHFAIICHLLYCFTYSPQRFSVLVKTKVY